MSHVHRPNGHHDKNHIKPADRKKLLKSDKWSYVNIAITKDELDTYFDFLNDAVVLRAGAVGLPLMTTSGIYGPIYPKERVRFNQEAKNVVEKTGKGGKEKSVIEELKHLKKTAKMPSDNRALLVDAKWVSGAEGGALPNVGKSANVFGATGSLFINNPDLNFPVLEPGDKGYHETLAYYGAKILNKGEEFFMGFDKVLFGMEYNTVLPGYITDYVMQEWGGGGLFVETHPFPHIWFPHPTTAEEKATNVCRILLGRVIPAKKSETKLINKDENKCLEIQPDPVTPQYHFTVFKVPTDGAALLVDECTIHNDSFCNGRQVVFVANTHANTVAMRETAAYKNLRVSDWTPPAKK